MGIVNGGVVNRWGYPGWLVGASSLHAVVGKVIYYLFCQTVSAVGVDINPPAAARFQAAPPLVAIVRFLGTIGDSVRPSPMTIQPLQTRVQAERIWCLCIGLLSCSLKRPFGPRSASSPPQPPQPTPPSCAGPQHGSILALPDSPWKKRDLFALGLGPICLHVCSIQSSVCLEVHLEGFILPSLRPHPTLPPTQQQHHCWLRRQLRTTKLSRSIYVLPDVCLSAFLLPPH